MKNGRTGSRSPGSQSPLHLQSSPAIGSHAFWALVLGCLLWLGAPVFAATVTAEVQPSEARPNQQFNYSIVIENGNVEAVPNLRLPLQIGMTSAPAQSNEISILNGRQTIRTRFTWPLAASEPGDFVIAAQAVQVDGQVTNTNEVKIKIKEGAQPESNGMDPLLQITVEKTDFYQSEVVPIKAQLYIHRSTNLRRLGLVEVAKSDFAIQRFPQQSEQSLEMIGGQPYYVLTFRSTLSALKAGKLEVGPASMEVLVDIQQQMNGNFPPGFFSMPGEPRKFTVRSQAVPVTVRPLPQENKPASFSGAVGDFTLNASASPTSLAVGEPVTVELSVAGSGNFDALTAPALVDPAGWKTYPVRRYNTAGQPDPAQPGFIERQTGFTQVIVPEKLMTAVPPFEMSFFSPTSGKYVTLRTQPIPIALKPGTATADGATGTIGAGASSEPGQTVRPPEADITDILEHLPSSPQWISAPSKPLHQQPAFWIANAVPLAVFVALVLVSAYRRRQERQANSPENALRLLWQELNAPGLDEAAFYRRAAHFIQASGYESGNDAVERVLDRYQTLNFSGAAAIPAASISKSERSEVLGALAPLLQVKRTPAPAPRLQPATALLAGAFLMALPESDATAAAAPEERYREITAALQKKDFNRAQAGAESLLGEGRLSPELFEIMGHTRYRQGDPGRAVLWYQRASLFTPRVPEIRQNLRHLDEKVRFLRFAGESPLQTFGLLLHRNTWLILAAAGGWLLLIGAGIAIASRSAAVRGWCMAAVVLGCILLPLGAAGAVLRPKGEDRVKDLWIVTTPGTKAYTAASSTAGTVIDLPPGSQIRLLEKRGAWNYVEIPNLPENLRGWIEADTITSLWPAAWPVALVP